jgi:sec-independent protein translocase protein TatA
MFGLGWGEILLVVVVIMLIFGVRKLPEIGSGLGQGIKNFRKSFREEDDQKQLDDKKNQDKKE